MDATSENQLLDLNFVQYHNILFFTNDSMPYLDYVITVVPLDKTTFGAHDNVVVTIDFGSYCAYNEASSFLPMCHYENESL